MVLIRVNAQFSNSSCLILLASQMGSEDKVSLKSLFSERMVQVASTAAPWVGAAFLAVAGAYQLMPFKRMCLRHCRSPLAFLMQVVGMTGPLRSLRIGVRHRWFCLGCCWALMLALLALGMMNLALMAAFAIAIFVEKTWRYGMVFARAVGVILILLSAAILIHPAIIPSLSSSVGM